MTEINDSVGEKIRDSATSLVYTLGEGTMALMATVSEGVIALGNRQGSNTLVITRALDDCRDLLASELHHGAVLMPGEFYQPDPDDELLVRHCPERLIARFKLLIDALLHDQKNGLMMNDATREDVCYVFTRMKPMIKPGELELDNKQQNLITAICGHQT